MSLPEERRRTPVGRIALGLVLLLLGVGWLLQTLGVVEVRWHVILAGALIAVGLALIVVGRHGGLITLGVILTVVLALTSLLDVPLEGGVGDRTHRPGDAAAVQDEYRLAIGRLVVDLRDVELSEGGDLEASVAIGELLILVPEGARVRVAGRAAMGEVILFGRSRGGLGVEQSATEGDGPPVDLRAAVGMGKLEVRT